MFFPARRWAMVADARALCAWAQAARPGDGCTWHIGNLVEDRASHPGLHLLAETVLILQERGFVASGGQMRVTLPTIRGRAYGTVRTGTGTAPRALLGGKITATEFRALEAVDARAGGTSVTQGVRDALSLPHEAAAALVAALRSRGWVEGRQLTDRGERMLR